MTKRLTAKPYFQTFDGPDPNVCTSDRDQSVTRYRPCTLSMTSFCMIRRIDSWNRCLNRQIANQERLRTTSR